EREQGVRGGVVAERRREVGEVVDGDARGVPEPRHTGRARGAAVDVEPDLAGAVELAARDAVLDDEHLRELDHRGQRERVVDGEAQLLAGAEVAREQRTAQPQRLPAVEHLVRDLQSLDRPTDDAHAATSATSPPTASASRASTAARSSPTITAPGCSGATRSR